MSTIKEFIVEDLKGTISEYGDYNDLQIWYQRLETIVDKGGRSGTISSLISSGDAISFFNVYKGEIGDLLSNTIEIYNKPINELKEFTYFEISDPLCLEANNQQLISWFAYEMICRELQEDMQRGKFEIPEKNVSTIDRDIKTEEVILYHGSMNKFSSFSFENLGAQGTGSDFGIYLTSDLEFAEKYANLSDNVGYIYEVKVNLANALSDNKITISHEKISDIIDMLHTEVDLLNDIDDTALYGIDKVKQTYIELLSVIDNDLAILAELSNVTGNREVVSKAFEEIGGYTHISRANQGMERKYNETIVLNPSNLEIIGCHTSISKETEHDNDYEIE